MMHLGSQLLYLTLHVCCDALVLFLQCLLLLNLDLRFKIAQHSRKCLIATTPLCGGAFRGGTRRLHRRNHHGITIGRFLLTVQALTGFAQLSEGY